jgi:TRAP-type C4-dicarboxylate transport system substrate-binding protein
MKRSYGIFLAILMVCVLILAGCAAPAPSQPAPAPKTPTPAPAPAAPITLKFAFDMPKTGAIVPGWEWFASELQKQSNGKVKVDFYGAAALFPQKDTPDSLKAGVADIANISLSSHSQYFPINFLFTLAGMEFPDLTREGFIAKYKAYMDLAQKYPELSKELADYKLLFWCPNPAYRLITKNKIVVPDDLKGVKVGSSAAQGQITKLSGGVWVQAVPNDAYENINKGVTDGAWVTWAQVSVYKLEEVATNFLDNGVTQESQQVCMNMKTWNSLPADIQKLIGDLTLETIGRSSDGQITAGDKGINNAKAKNRTINTLTPEQRAQWDALYTPVAEDWVKNAQSKGFAKAPDLLKDLQAARAAAMK